MKKEGLKIISAELENFQSLEHKLVEVQGKSIVVIGKNGGSKSALLRAIQSPLNSKIVPQKAIKKGQETAFVKLKLKGIVPGDSDEKEFEYKIEFTEKNQKGIISVKDEEGNEIKKRGIQKDIIGDVSFDIDEFIRLGMTNSGSKSAAGVREQVEILRQFLKKEEKVKLNELDKEKKDKYDERTQVNKDVKALETQLKEFNKFSEEDIKEITEDKSEDIKKLQDDLGNISVKAVNYSKAIAAQSSLNEVIKSQDITLKALPVFTSLYKTALESKVDLNRTYPGGHKLVEQIKEGYHYLNKTSEEFSENEDKLAKVEKWLSKNKEPKTEEIRKQIEELNVYQEKFLEIQKFKDMHKEKVKKEKESTKLTDRLKKIQAEKKDVFANSTMPVKDLSFDEDGIYYKELPFDGDHHPSSHIIGVGVKLAMAMNPNLRCVFIKDGSLLDKKTFSAVLKMIEKEGYQLFIEMVDWNAEDAVSVEYAEQFISK